MRACPTSSRAWDAFLGPRSLAPHQWAIMWPLHLLKIWVDHRSCTCNACWGEPGNRASYWDWINLITQVKENKKTNVYSEHQTWALRLAIQCTKYQAITPDQSLSSHSPALMYGSLPFHSFLLTFSWVVRFLNPLPGNLRTSIQGYL